MGPIPFDLSAKDAVAWLREQPGASVGLVITDPAYESLEKHRAIRHDDPLKYSTASSNDWFTIVRTHDLSELYRSFMQSLFHAVVNRPRLHVR